MLSFYTFSYHIMNINNISTGTKRPAPTLQKICGTLNDAINDFFDTFIAA
ncbi:hypothetical protein Hanom_Chr03g00278131 [Helianthus anomalus]